MRLPSSHELHGFRLEGRTTADLGWNLRTESRGRAPCETCGKPAFLDPPCEVRDAAGNLLRVELKTTCQQCSTKERVQKRDARRSRPESKEDVMLIPAPAENPILIEATANAEVDQVGPHTALVCPCGCGRALKPGNRYGSPACWSRHRSAGSVEPAPAPARLCECGCGRPVGPRGKRFATISCSAKRGRGNVSPEARAKMSAAAKARIARDGYVRPGQPGQPAPVAYTEMQLAEQVAMLQGALAREQQARQDAQAELGKVRTELLEATPPEPAEPIRLDPPRGSLSPPPEPAEPDEWGRTHLHDQIARVKRNLEGWQPQTLDELQRREDLAHTLAALERADSVIRAAQADLAAATRQAGQQASEPRNALLDAADLTVAWAVHWLRQLPNDTARKRAYQLACQMPEVP